MAAQLCLREEDVVRLALEFLSSRGLHLAQVALEREAGVINAALSHDALFLRQLVIDGQWDDCLEFVQPLEALEAFDGDRVKFLILRQKYVELLCVRSEAGCNALEGTVDEVVRVLERLEKYATKEEHSALCLLLTLPRLGDHLAFRDWNPTESRIKCFNELYPLIESFLPADRRPPSEIKFSKNDRLMQIIIKGMLYESCVNFCQEKATGGKDPRAIDVKFSHLLDGSGFGDSDLSLLSWLRSIPGETFAVPFEQRTLNVDVERLERPALEASWTEHMLVRPIKPKTFPHSAVSFCRPRSAADVMTRSLLPPASAAPTAIPAMALSTGDLMPGFRLAGAEAARPMIASVDRLFLNEDAFMSDGPNFGRPLPQIAETTAPPTPPSPPSPPPAALGLYREFQQRKGGQSETPLSTPP